MRLRAVLALVLLAVLLTGCDVTCELKREGDACPPGQTLMWYWGEHWLCVYPGTWRDDMHRCFYGRD